MDSEAIIEVQGLMKKYGKRIALNNLNFSIKKGEVFGLLGPNGAGKSTFISVLTTLSKPTSGEIRVNGFSAVKESGKIKKYIGFVPQEIAIYPTLSAYDNLNFWAGIYGLKGSLKKERVNEALSIVQLKERAGDRADKFSGGMKRRLNIAIALLHHPEILVMDEPTVGVDIQSRRCIMDAVRNLKKEGKTIIFTSHYIDEMENYCDRLAVLFKGEINGTGTVDELLEFYGTSNLEEILLGLE